MKKILVTGGTVFVSKYVAGYFRDNGYEVYVLNRNTKPQLENKCSLPWNWIPAIMIQGWNHVSNEICQQITNEDTKQAINELSHGIYDYAIANPGIFEAMLWYKSYENEELKLVSEGLWYLLFQSDWQIRYRKKYGKSFA